MRRNPSKANAIWQMLLDAGPQGIHISVLAKRLGNPSYGHIDVTLAGMERYGMRVAENDNVLFAMACLDEPEQDWEVVKDKNYFVNRYR